MKNVNIGIISVLLISFACTQQSEQKSTSTDSTQANEKAEVLRFFSENSFWNTPIEENPKIDKRSDYWISLLEKDQSCENFGINLKQYTIPIYLVDSTVKHTFIKEISEVEPDYPSHQHPDFKKTPIPLPENFSPSPGGDMHAAIVDTSRNKIWDMFYVKKDSNSNWMSGTGMVYDLYGSGVFEPDDFDVKTGESIHRYGPGRAAGVPIIAGTILFDEVKRGEINHKLSCAVRYVAFQEYVYPPATWTDGNFNGGIPEGATIQLNPALDLSQFDLLPGEKAVARALQKYGMVIVDFAKGNALYGEGLWYDSQRSWEGVLRDWQGGISEIPLKHYRVLDCSNTRQGGDRMKEFFQNALNQPYNCDDN